MALNSSQQWWVRTDGNELNGGGYDSAIAGAGTNYSDQAAAQLSLSDLASPGAGTTITSATGGFTSAMIGNIIRIASGTNFTAGYYAITGWTSLNQITVDKAATTGVGASGVGRIGGAHASLCSYTTGGTGLPSPILTSPMAAGNTVNIRGSGSLDPSNGSPDYDYSAGYWIFPASNNTSGLVKFVGYNGRPLIKTSGLFRAVESFIWQF